MADHTPTTIAFLHTAAVHVATFDGLLDDLGYHGTRTHKVMPELLDHARELGLDYVRAKVLAVLASLATADAVVCTCSTIGPLADTLAATHPHIFRIDRPVMEAACQTGPDVMVALCLHSTQGPTLDLLQDCAAQAGRAVRPHVVLCADAWPLFEQGDHTAFAARIATTIRAALAEGPMPDCILLAQASMRAAASLLQDLGVPVLSSPALAAERAIAIAGR
ncbi:MAG: hypothetical protein RLZZ437_654 [Pseudomonadota bacterium]|jgi:hypothetical protein